MDNYEFKMESNDNLELMRIKKEKEIRQTNEEEYATDLETSYRVKRFFFSFDI